MVADAAPDSAAPFVRDAADDDLPAITALYNALITSTTYEYTERPHTLDARADWLRDKRGAGLPVLVADAGGEVVGVASYGEFRDNSRWPGYRFTVEHTVHVDESWWGAGIGRALIEDLAGRARAAGMHVMVGAIDASNTGSIRFHERLGFVEVGRMPQVGEKFGRWLDLVLVQRRLD